MCRYASLKSVSSLYLAEPPLHDPPRPHLFKADQV